MDIIPSCDMHQDVENQAFVDYSSNGKPRVFHIYLSLP